MLSARISDAPGQAREHLRDKAPYAKKKVESAVVVDNCARASLSRLEMKLRSPQDTDCLVGKV